MTVRARVTALATLAVVLVLCASGAVLVALQRETVTSSLDESLTRDAGAIASDVRRSSSPPSTLHPRGDADVVAKLVVNGRVIAASRNTDAARAAVARGGHRTVIRAVTLADGRAATLSVAAPTDDINENISFLTRTMTVGIPAIAAVLAALVWWLAGRTLRPVEQIRARVASMSGTDVDKRVPEPPGSDEVARLARTMNALLERIEDASARQRRFVADASHELRTPLARMRAEIEVDVVDPGHADAAATRRSALEELDSLQRLVEDLLFLARSDDNARVRLQPVDLAAVVLEEAAALPANGLVVDTSAVGPARVNGDPEQLRRVVRNLLDNALRYADAHITVALSDYSTETTLSVSDDGPGVPPHQRDHIFERFARVDDARTAGTGGAGLGLAIARDIVLRHGGTITVDSNGNPGAHFCVRLPN